MAQRDNLGILARVPLASGLLSGKYKPGATFAANDVRATFDAEKMKRDLIEVERLQKEEVPAGVPMAKWAMAWCLKNPVVTRIIPGCKNPEQVKRQRQRGGVGMTDFVAPASGGFNSASRRIALA